MKKLDAPKVYMMAYYEVVAYIHHLVSRHGLHILSPNTLALERTAKMSFTPEAFLTFLREGLNVELKHLNIPVVPWNPVIDVVGRYITATTKMFAPAHISHMRNAAWEIMPLLFNIAPNEHGKQVLDRYHVDSTDFSCLRDKVGNYSPRLAKHPEDECLFDTSRTWEWRVDFYADLVDLDETSGIKEVAKGYESAMYVSFYSSIGGAPMFRTGRVVQRIYQLVPSWKGRGLNPFEKFEIVVESPNDILLKGGATQRLKLRPELCFSWRSKLLPQGPLRDEETNREVKLYWD